MTNPPEDPMKGLTEEQKKDIVSWQTYKQTMQGMSEVIWNMKEIPILPSERIPEDDNHRLTRVELPDQGGVNTYMANFDHPYKGFPYGDFVAVIDYMKKWAKGIFSGLYHAKVRFSLIPLLLAFKPLMTAGIYSFWRLIVRFRIKPYRYSTAIRELYRAFSVPQKEDKRTKELRYMLRDLICMTLEFDNAYRFRAQDILAEADQEALKRRPIKELKRLVNLIIGREKDQAVKDTWRLLRYFVNFYLRFDQKTLRMITGVLASIDKEQFQLDDGDKAYCTPRTDYTFGYIATA